MNYENRSKIFEAGIIAVATLAVTSAVALISYQDPRAYDHRRVPVLADTNNDGVVSKEEQMRVYRDLGKVFIEGTTINDLTLEEKLRYVKMKTR